MLKNLILLSLVLGLSACNTELKKPKADTLALYNSTISYANGFTIEDHGSYQLVAIKNPWPGATQTFSYALVKEGAAVPDSIKVDAVLTTPLKSIVVTSTTHIPSLEMLGVEDRLVGFPNCNYISSEKTRVLIDNGSVKELGKNEDLNTEVLIDLSPDAVVTFAVDGDNTTVSTIQKTGIPVLYNADWTEVHPLGKAEWIKFFGVLFGKEKEADRLFSEIESNYNGAKAVAQSTGQRPTVLSGAMYKDVWYLPQGNSWAAQFIEDANGNYLWGDSEGTGSLSLNLEAVLDKGQEAQYWIGPGQFTSKEQLKEGHAVYLQFNAFKNDAVYSFTTKKGATGGVLYYELAPNRPDMVLKDIIKILHPDLLPDYELYFFSKLN